MLPHGAGVAIDLLDGWVNDAIERISRMREWTRLKKQGTLQLSAEYSTGTVTIASGATTGTGSGTTFTSAMTGRQIRFANQLAYYTFTYVSATSFSIERGYEETDNLIAGGFSIWQNIYELPSDVDTVLGIRNSAIGVNMWKESREWLNDLSPSRFTNSEPYAYVPAEDSTNGLLQVEVYPVPTVGRTIYLEYRAKPPLFDLTDPDVDQMQFPDWISVPAVWAAVESKLYSLSGNMAGRGMAEAEFQRELQVMLAEDARRQPPQKMQEADRFTQHRVRRGSYRYGSEIINWSSDQ